MAKGNAQVAPVLSSYQQLGNRVFKLINSQAAQKAKTVTLLWAESDDREDWARLIEEIAENDNVTVAHRDDGYQLFWTVPKDD